MERWKDDQAREPLNSTHLSWYPLATLFPTNSILRGTPEKCHRFADLMDYLLLSLSIQKDCLKGLGKNVDDVNDSHGDDGGEAGKTN